jgi:Patatin-like phospholipase
MERNHTMKGFHVSAMRHFFPVIALVCLTDCSAVHRPPATVTSIIADGDATRSVQRDIIENMIDILARRAVARGDRTLDLLMLSGGGQHGAYGIGFLRGWRSRTDGPMPRFDLVTGISTGALQAPFALLGTDEALNAAAALYGKAVDEFAPTFDWLFWLRRTGGLIETSRFQHMIETVFDERLCRQLRPHFEAGRQLAIATTDFDLGIGRIWDIGREMDCSRASLDRVHKLLLATTAIPGIFPPVVIDGHVHADGGIVANLLPVLDLDGYRRLAARLRGLGVTGRVTVRLWVVMNLWTHPTPTVMDPADRSAMSQRGTLLLFWTQQSQLPARLADLARAASTDIPGLNVEMRYTAIPSELATEPGANMLFDEAWMLRLEKLGYERARSTSPWDEISSPYERPVPIPSRSSEQ